jgi:hypothetical protein
VAGSDPLSGGAGRLLRACLAVLLAALALSWAVEIVRCLWPWLVGGAAVAGVLWLGWALFKARRGRW